MSFANPNFLWLLAVVPPALVLFFWWSWRVRQRLMTQFIQARLLPGLIAGVSVARQKISAAILLAAVVLLIVALARPQWGYDLDEVTQRGLDIVVAIDTSKSMLAADIAPNRLARAKLAALDLMHQAKSDRLGLVAFAGSAFLQCPLTSDDVAFRQSVEAIDVNTLPDGGTALAEAIETALKAFKEEGNYKVLVLFTDGEDHDSDALEAAKQAAENGLLIFTIGIGSAEGEILQVQGANGQLEYVRDAEGNVVKSHLNDSLLQQISKAAAPGGFYLPLRGANTIDVLYQRGLAPLPKSEAKERWARRAIERYHWPLALAVVLLIVEIFFPERKREPKPAPAGAPAAGPVLARAALVALLLLPAVAWSSPAGALREYKAGKYDKSLAEYERLIEDAIGKNKPESLEQLLKKAGDKKPEELEALIKQYLEKASAGTGRLNFNAGAAAYKAGDLEKAGMHFTLAANDPDWKLQEQAYYNLGNTEYKLGDQTQDPGEKMSHWQKAVDSYKAALGLAPQDADAEHNQKFVEKRIEELKKEQQQQQRPPPPSEAAKKAKAAADEAVRRHEYGKALEIMNTQLKQDPTTAYYSDYIKRLGEVNDVKETTRN